MTPPLVTINVYTPLPGRQLLTTINDINVAQTAVQIESALNGGWGQASAGATPPDATRPLVYPSLPRPVHLVDRAHVEILVGTRLLYMGMLQSGEQPGGSVTGLTMLGYGFVALDWDEFSTNQTGPVTSGVLLRAAMTQAAALVRVAPQSGNPGVLHAWSDVNNQTPGQIAERFATEGANGVAWQWDVYSNGDPLLPLPTLRFLPRTLPSTGATYTLNIGDGLIVRPDFTDVLDACRVEYTDPAGVARVTPWVYAPGVSPATANLRKRRVQGGELTSAGAQAFAVAYATFYGAPRITADLKVTGWGTLQLASGGAQPAYLARAGEWATLPGYGSLQLTQVQANLTSGETSIQLGGPPPGSFATLMQRIQQTTEATRGERSVFTGARRSAVAAATPIDTATARALTATGISDASGGTARSQVRAVRGRPRARVIDQTGSSSSETVTPHVADSATAPSTLTNSTGVSTGTTIAAVSATPTKAEIDTNFGRLTTIANTLRTQVQSLQASINANASAANDNTATLTDAVNQAGEALEQAQADANDNAATLSAQGETLRTAILSLTGG